MLLVQPFILPILRAVNLHVLILKIVQNVEFLQIRSHVYNNYVHVHTCMCMHTNVVLYTVSSLITYLKRIIIFPKFTEEFGKGGRGEVYMYIVFALQKPLP